MANVCGRSVEDGLPVTVSTENGRITKVESTPGLRDDDLPYVTAGIFDMQVNGFRGKGYTLERFERGELEEIIGYLAAAGTAQHLATIVTSGRRTILRNLQVIAAACADDADISAAVPGIHLEGPFISPDDGPRGAHNAEHVRDPDFSEFLEWQEAADGRIVMVTLAPERPGGVRFIEELTDRGIVASIGHTAADPETIRRAVSAGATCSTHLGNGSHAMIPRHDNYIWEQLASDELWMGLIPDGFHLPFAALKSLAKAKGFDKTVLVSDVSRMGGLEPGEYHWGAIHVRVYEDGHLGVIDTPYLAGSGHLLDWSIPQFIKASGCSLRDAINMCTRNPADVCGFDFGRLEPGRPAHFTLFSYAAGNDRLRTAAVWRNGIEVFSGESPG